MWTVHIRKEVGVAKVTIRLGLMATNGRTHNVKSTIEDRDAKVFMVCPKCEASKTASAVRCAAGCCDDVFVPSEVTKRGRMEGDQLIVLSADEIREAKVDAALPPGDFTLAVHPADAFEAECAEYGASYVFVPDKGDPFYTLLLEKAADQNLALVGMLSLSQNGQAKLYRLHDVGGRLMLREALLPNQTAMLAPIPGATPKPKEAELFSRLIEAMVEDFDPAGYTNERLIAVRKLVDKAAGTKPTPIRAAKKGTVNVTDLEAQLEASLAAAKKAS